MRLFVYLALLFLAALAVGTANLAIALGLAGVKATLVGLEYMELRHAARAHALGYVGFIAALVLVLVALTART